MKNILNVNKISLKPIFMSLAILFAVGVSVPHSFEKVASASHSDSQIFEEDPDGDGDFIIIEEEEEAPDDDDNDYKPTCHIYLIEKNSEEEEEEEEADDKDNSNLGFKSDDFPSANDPVFGSDTKKTETKIYYEEEENTNEPNNDDDESSNHLCPSIFKCSLT